MPSRAKRACLVAATVAIASLAVLNAAAQRRIEPPEFEQPTHSDVVLGGNELRQTVACDHGNAVYIQGQSNQVTVQGVCRFVRVQGNRNHVFVEGKSPVHVEGNENFIEVTDPNTPFSERGERNRVERRAH